jgi:hypothetical protein
MPLPVHRAVVLTPDASFTGRLYVFRESSDRHNSVTTLSRRVHS